MRQAEGLTSPELGVLVDNEVPPVFVRRVEAGEGVRLRVEDPCDVEARDLKGDGSRRECESHKKRASSRTTGRWERAAWRIQESADVLSERRERT